MNCCDTTTQSRRPITGDYTLVEALVLLSGTISTRSAQHGITIGCYLAFIFGNLLLLMSVESVGLASAHWSYLPQEHLHLQISSTCDCAVHAVRLHGLDGSVVLFGVVQLLDRGFWCHFFQRWGSKYPQSSQKEQAHIIDGKKPQTPSPRVVSPLELTVEELKTRMNQDQAYIGYLDLRCFGWSFARASKAGTNKASLANTPNSL